jgi:O-antigen ligase
MTTAPVAEARQASSGPHLSGLPLATVAAAALSFIVWASCSTAGLLELGPLTLRPIDLGALVLVVALLPQLGRPAADGLRADRWVSVAGLTLLGVVLASAAWVSLDEPALRSVALPSAVRVLQLGVVAVAAGLLCRTWAGRRQLLRWLLIGAFAVSAVYALAHLGLTLPVELLDLNPGKSAVGPVAVASLVLALTAQDVPLAYRGALGAMSAVNLLFAVSMTAYLVTLAVVPLMVWMLVRLQGRPLRVQVAAYTAVLLLCTAFAYTGLRLLRPDALPERLDAPLTITTPLGGAGSGKGGAGGAPQRAEAVEDGSEAVAGATILHRAILMSTALELFEDAPAVGVGWTRGDDPGIVDEPEVVDEMKRRFPSGYASLFTDVSPLGAHNALFQVLAELGVVGGLPLLTLLVALVVGARRATTRAGRTPEQTRSAAVCLALVGVALGFLMFTGLYPGQVETLLAAAAIGATAMLPRQAKAQA